MKRVYRFCITIVCLFALSLGLHEVTFSDGQKDSSKIDPKADQVIRELSEHLRGLNSFRVDVTTLVKIKAPSVNMEMTSSESVAVRRPDKFALILKEGVMGTTVICDGQKVYTYFPMLQEYTVTDRPERPDHLVTPPTADMMGSEGKAFIESLLQSNPRDAIMEGVTQGQYIGLEEIDGVECHHLKFFQNEFDWEMWVEAGHQPLIKKIVPDISKKIAKSGEFALIKKDMKIEASLIFNDWTINVDLPDDQFTFTPPEGAKKVDSFFGAMGGPAPDSTLGGAAPPFELDLLDGGKMSLTEHKDKNIVILDFWATWCGPCRRSMPILAEVAKEYQDKGVVFYAVDQKEDPEKIRTFLKETTLTLTVALDKDGRVGNLYHVRGIPHTVIIGKDGSVQAVHVGFQPDLKKQLTDGLNALLAGKNWASEMKRRAAENKTGATPSPLTPSLRVLPPSEGMELAWSVQGGWGTVASDPRKKTIYAVSSTGACVQMNAAGERQREFQIGDRLWYLRTANLVGDSERELITFCQGGCSVKARDLQGNLLWTYTADSVVKDIRTDDLNGDGLDEMVISYEGKSGLHVVDSQGRILWKYADDSYVRSAGTGDLNGDGVPEVVTTSMGGVLVLGADGIPIKGLHTGFFTSVVRSSKVSQKDSTGAVLIGGTKDEKPVFMMLDFDGQTKWSIDLPSGSERFIRSTEVASSRPWLAVELSGKVYVVDTILGEIIAQVDRQGGWGAQIGWLDTSDTEPPLLLVATGRELNAFRVVTKEMPPPSSSKPPASSTPSVQLSTVPQRVSGGVIQGHATRRVAPVYPHMARIERVSGSVEVEVVIDENGNVISANAISGHPRLQQAAIDAAQQWKFRPVLRNGQAMKVIGVLIFNFRL